MNTDQVINGYRVIGWLPHNEKEGVHYAIGVKDTTVNGKKRPAYATWRTDDSPNVQHDIHIFGSHARTAGERRNAAFASLFARTGLYQTAVNDMLKAWSR
jgi:hypothetical protein